MWRVADKDDAAKKEYAINPEIPSEYCQSVYLHALLEDVSGNKASSVYSSVSACLYKTLWWPIFNWEYPLLVCYVLA